MLISDTGGGHRASAQALEAALKELYPNQLEISIVDIWTQYSPWPFNTCVAGYAFLQKRQALWWFTYHWSCFLPTREATTAWAKMSGTVELFQQCLGKYDPDLIVSLHPLTQDLPIRAMKANGKVVPFVTVVTDLASAHPHWFDKRVDRCFVPSTSLLRMAKYRGLSDEQLRLYGLPIRPTFWQAPKAKELTKRALGLRADMQTVLVVGGGDGVGGLGTIVEEIAALAVDELPGQVQVVVVCGRNHVLRKRLAKTRWPKEVRVSVHGFITQMSDFMAASDVIVTKAGPGTIAEANARALPIMLSSFLPGQEAGNVDYVTSGGFGVYRKKPKRIARGVISWLADPVLLATMSANSLRAARPLATYQIANDIGSMLCSASQLMPNVLPPSAAAATPPPLAV